MNNNAENVIDIYPYFQGGQYERRKEVCKCGCGIELKELLNPDYYDYENNLKEE